MSLAKHEQDDIKEETNKYKKTNHNHLHMELFECKETLVVGNFFSTNFS